MKATPAIPLLASWFTSMFALASFAAAGPTTGPAMVSYVGLLTVDASPTLEAQMGLPAGLGVVIQAVDEASPAAKAELAVHDVVTRLDDQLIINPPQFSALVRMHRPGQTVRLEVIRRGKTLAVPVELAEKALPPDDALGLRLPAAPARVINMATFTDGDHVIAITARGDDRRVRITDPSGVELYEGPLNTPADHERLPDEVRGKITAIEQNWRRVQEFWTKPGATP